MQAVQGACGSRTHSREIDDQHKTGQAIVGQFRWRIKQHRKLSDAEDLKERREQLLRYCAMERESTDPLALGLLHDIVLELQADLQAVATKLRRLAEPQPNILK
jgi:hypothetical protein